MRHRDKRMIFAKKLLSLTPVFSALYSTNLNICVELIVVTFNQVAFIMELIFIAVLCTFIGSHQCFKVEDVNLLNYFGKCLLFLNTSTRTRTGIIIVKYFYFTNVSHISYFYIDLCLYSFLITTIHIENIHLKLT